MPDATHAELVRRAEAEGMTLRQYAIEVLSNHCALPTTSAWLDGLARRRARGLVDVDVDGSDAVARSRCDDDEAIAHGA